MTVKSNWKQLRTRAFERAQEETKVARIALGVIVAVGLFASLVAWLGPKVYP